MTNLKILTCEYDDCPISDENIKNLNLVCLNARHNPNISNINHMTNLKVLECSGDCGISDENIKDLNLFTLNAGDNSKISDVSHMTNLKHLERCDNCGISDENVKNLDLIFDGTFMNPNSNKVMMFADYL